MARVSGRKTAVSLTVTNMKVFISMTRKMGKVFFHGRVAIFIEASIKMTNGMDMAKCTGLMDQCTKVNGMRVFSMVQD